MPFLCAVWAGTGGFGNLPALADVLESGEIRNREAEG